jgi:hypothetical protein
MKRVADLDLGPAPLDDPGGYPGRTPDESYVLIGDRIATLRPVALRRLDAWRIEAVPQEDSQWRTATSYRPLSYGLLRANSAPVHRRVPLVAVGSNASPPQLVRKLASEPCSRVLPVVMGRLRGIGLAFSAHVSRPGYLPAAPAATADPLDTTPVWVTLLDTDQLAVMDRTELNYEPVVVAHPDGGWILELASGERLHQCALYRSRHSVLDVDACQQPGQLIAQSAVRAELARRVPALPADLEGWRKLGEWLAPTNAGENLPSRPLTAVPEAADSAVVLPDDGLGRFAVPEAHAIDCRYGDVTSSLEGLTSGAVTAGARAVLASGRIDRHGEPCITLDRSLPENSRFRTGHAFVRFRSTQEGDTPSAREERSRLGLVCRVVNDPQVPPGHAGIDQIVRDALGVARRETVWLVPWTRIGRLARLFDVMPRRYVVCRAQIADLHLVEQRACALTPATFDLLGIEAGDEVVLEGAVDENTGRITEARLKAVPTPDSMFQERVKLSGGGLDSRFPSARDALGVHPDLPWVFIDQDVRESLLLGRLGAVRVRASRRYQARKDTRDLLLLLLLAGIGVVTVVESQLWRWLSLALLGTVAVGAAFWRLSDRLR